MAHERDEERHWGMSTDGILAADTTTTATQTWQSCITLSWSPVLRCLMMPVDFGLQTRLHIAASSLLAQMTKHRQSSRPCRPRA
jgi:hypothetical protein